jgi:beta-lactamase regulating signal transducer with metallopeptidase domain
MSEIFLKVLNMSIAASWLILAVLLLRLVLKKAPKWITVALWGIVALRLVIPFSFESALSMIPSAETFNLYNIQYETPVVSTGIPAVNNAVNPVLGETFAPNPGGSVNPLYVWTSIASILWFIGIAAMLLYAVICYVRVRRSVAEGVPYKGNIFLCDHVKSPFILGVVRPRIYLPSSMDAVTMELVIAHEKAHLARRDHWWKPMGFLILAVHWFNPLCWIAYVLLCRDIELACDEKVIRQMDLDGKKRYSTALLECSIGRRLVTICPLAFGEVGVSERVKNVLNYKKPTFWVIAAAAAVCVVVAVCFLTDPAGAETSGDLSLQNAQFTLNEDGCVVAAVNGEIVQISTPVPPPTEWAEQDLAGRNEAATLFEPTYFCAGLVSSKEGWLVVSYSRGVAAADTYVYRTSDGGLTWTETNRPECAENNDTYTWLPNQLGLISGDRLLIAYRRFMGTPVFLTKDGGATWEALEMPQGLAYEVESIQVDGKTVTIALSGDAGCVVSTDRGDTWEYSP